MEVLRTTLVRIRNKHTKILRIILKTINIVEVVGSEVQVPLICKEMQER